MAKTIDKLLELEYNEHTALKVIETDEDLKTILSDELKQPFDKILLGKVDKAGEEYIENLFNQVILTKKELIDKYVRFSKETSTPKTVSVEKPKQVAKKEKELPRRYGKQNILKDIETQGGKATPLQNAMLKVNDLKNIYVNLSARGIKDMLGGTSLLSDVDCRDIVSVVTIAERKLEEILKRKK